MNEKYRLTPQTRIILKNPIGTLIKGSFTETIKQIKDLIEKEKPPSIISVGDMISKNLLKNEVIPKLLIVDNKVMRKPISPILVSVKRCDKVSNPPGTITRKAIKAIQTAIKNNDKTKLIVDGEEDLLTLIAVLYAPDNSFVLYGQPQEGVVVVKVTSEKKTEVNEILNAMEKVRNPK